VIIHGELMQDRLEGDELKVLGSGEPMPEGRRTHVGQHSARPLTQAQKITL
jgi:hypothetical protein